MTRVSICVVSATMLLFLSNAPIALADPIAQNTFCNAGLQLGKPGGVLQTLAEGLTIPLPPPGSGDAAGTFSSAIENVEGVLKDCDPGNSFFHNANQDPNKNIPPLGQ